MEPDHVLVPLDGSPLADEALAHALAVFDCRTTVLNVVTPLDASMAEGGVLETDKERIAAAQERAETVVERASQRVATEGRTIETTTETGGPADAILQYVEGSDIDHIVMGSHGGERGEFTRRLLGTVSTKVVSDAPVSVTVVR